MLFGTEKTITKNKAGRYRHKRDHLFFKKADLSVNISIKWSKIAKAVLKPRSETRNKPSQAEASFAMLDKDRPNDHNVIAMVRVKNNLLQEAFRFCRILIPLASEITLTLKNTSDIIIT